MANSCFESPASLALLPGSESRTLPALLEASDALAAEAANLGRGLHSAVRRAVGDLVRAVNCHYSNLIEGHDLPPHAIERAFRDDWSADPRQRALQREAVAHVEVQRLIDDGALHAHGLGSALVRALHRELGNRLPDELLWVTDAATGARRRVVPGDWREQGVAVGAHVAIDAPLVPAFMAHFDWGYEPRRVGRSRGVIAAAAAHHRLVWIHPFLDLNGRVARLHTHACLRHWGMGPELWPVARGLALTADRYQELLRRADAIPQGMSDGRGTLSDGRLCDLIAYVIETCRAQVAFMKGLLDPPGVLARLTGFIEAEAARGALDRRVRPFVERLFVVGEVYADELAGLLGVTDGPARGLVGPLEARGLIVGGNEEEPYRMAFPASVSDLLFPGLFAPPDAER